MKILRYLFLFCFPLLIQAIPIFEEISGIVERNIESMSPMGIATWASLQAEEQKPIASNGSETQANAVGAFGIHIAPFGLKTWANLQSKNS